MHPIIQNLEKPEIIKTRLQEFQELRKQDNNSWFSELCFCILTANSQAARAIAIQEALGPEKFLKLSQEELANTIKNFGHRFYNNKAKYIVEARKYKDIKNIIFNLTGKQAREWLAKNIKGIGYKEASHFLRNLGWHDIAIIDRHILKFMLNNNLINNIPKTITPKIYINFEKILEDIDPKLDQLDLILWYHMTGKVLK